MASTTGLVKSFSEVLDEYQVWATSPIPRVSLGLPWFDNQTRGGIAPGEVCIAIARPGVGKTQLACNVVYNNHKVPTLFISLEMPAAAIAARLAAIATLTPGPELEEALRADGQHPALEEAKKLYKKLVVVDKSGLNLKQIRQVITESSETFGEPVRLVVIDFLERIGGVKTTAIEHVNNAASEIKNIARDLDVGIILLHQVSRSEGETGSTPLSSASGKYGCEEHADYLIGMFRPSLDKYMPEVERNAREEEFFLQWLKNRHGNCPTEGVCHRYDKSTMTIRPWNETRRVKNKPILDYRDMGWEE